MPEVSWRLNGTALQDYGFQLVGGNFQTHGVSTVTLQRPCDISASQVLAYGDSVLLEWYDAGAPAWRPFFRGKCTTVPKHGSAQSEGHSYEIQDAWAELETTVYQEPWLVGGDTEVTMPRAVFGQNVDGTTINVGAMIDRIITMSGVDLAVGTIPAGMTPLPSEANNVTCMELLLRCLELHPDWIPYIDHTTSPRSTFNIVTVESASATTLYVSGSSGVELMEITERLDLMPTGVRIYYETSDEIDGVVSRKIYLDVYPAESAEVGPRVIVAHIPLAGEKAQIQKTRLYCETLPESAEDAKPWLKKKFPQIKDIPDAHFTVSAWDKELLPDPSDIDEVPISERHRRLAVTDADDLPRELLKGSIESWMRLKVGTVLVNATLTAASGATDEERALLVKLPPVPVTACNAAAGNSLKKNTTSYTPADSIPTGVAEAVYKGIRDASKWQGKISRMTDEIPLGNQLGRILNLYGGDAAWETMRAPISSMDWDGYAGKSTLTFGPLPSLAPQDFIEQMRRLRSRPPVYFTVEERSTAEKGSASGPSAAGDTVGGYDHPSAPVAIIGGGGVSAQQPFQLVASGTAGDNILKVRESTLAGAVPAGFTAGFKEFTVSASGVIYAKLTINGTTGAVTGRAVENGATLPANTDTVFHDQIGSYTVTGSGGAAVISATNTRYGPIPANICRNWYAAAAPYFGVTFL